MNIQHIEAAKSYPLDENDTSTLIITLSEKNLSELLTAVRAGGSELSHLIRYVSEFGVILHVIGETNDVHYERAEGGPGSGLAPYLDSASVV